MTETAQLCTKPAGFPLDPLNLGGCILERGHSGPCGFEFGNGVLRIQRHDGPHQADGYMTAAERYYRLTRRNFRVSLVATAASVLSSAYLIWSAFTR